MRAALLLCLGTCVASAQAVVFSDNPVFSPPWASIPSCGGSPFSFSQTVSQPWTAYNCNNIPTSGGVLMATGTGYCSGLFQYCQVADGEPASPWFSPKQQTNSTGNGFLIYEQVWSTPAGGFPGLQGWGCAIGGMTTVPTPPQAVAIPPCCSSCTGIGVSPANGCPEDAPPSGVNPQCDSPIVIDTDGEGFFLTSAAEGVPFRTTAGSIPVRMAWTDPNHRNGWLALPRDGKVQSLSQLFGNFTLCPGGRRCANGYEALAQYDLNGDGVIDARDGIYPQLRVWVDSNHDGVAQPEELHTLQELRVEHISLKYHLSERTDQFGNAFRYVARIDDQNAPLDRRCYDVFLKTLPLK